MLDNDPALVAFVTHGREERNLEYKGTSGPQQFAWSDDSVRAKIARTAMGMANIGGGAIVLGMDQVTPDRWTSTGVAPAIAATYQHDRVQQYVNHRSDPYVALALRFVEWQGAQFIIIQVAGFDELPVVCTRGSGSLRQGAIYTRSHDKHETVEVQSQTEMRELLDRAIRVGVQNRLRPVFQELKVAGFIRGVDESDEQQFQTQRGSL